MSRDGKLVFSSGQTRNNIWGLPLSGNAGKVQGAPFRITDTLANLQEPTLSPDERELLFSSDQNGHREIWEKDLTSGKETMVVTGPRGKPTNRTRYLRLGGRFAYYDGHSAYLFDPASGESRKFSDNASYAWSTNSTDEIALLRTHAIPAGVDAFNLKTSQRIKLLESKGALFQSFFSPDDRWILFLATTGPTTAQIFSARFQGMKPIPEGEWIAVTDGKGLVDKPRFSPDGRPAHYSGR